jgi:hypothetical protein
MPATSGRALLMVGCSVGHNTVLGQYTLLRSGCGRSYIKFGIGVPLDFERDHQETCVSDYRTVGMVLY